ncbi:hypothetical protein VTP01DRAFT_1382 [Rhizomucor pusillus]|uniref:uncharacterized protein n=1 Tax=Rhizomucor pusillus TaxID=4840 RepID=UPI0037441EA8
MTVKRGIDACIQTEDAWDDDRLRKYRRMKRKIIEFIAKHKSAQLSIDRANRKVQALQRGKRQSKTAVDTDNMETSQQEDVEEEDELDEGEEDEEEEDELVEEDEEMAEPSKTIKRQGSSRKKPVEIPRDEDGNIKLPFQIGSLNILSLGSVVHDRPSFHSERYIWPVGYCVERTYMSTVDPNGQTTYTCRIEDGGDGPVFTIHAADAPDKEMSAKTPTGAWALVIKEANRVRRRGSACNAISGPEYFGLSNPLVIEMVESLEGADKCVKYRCHNKR